MREVVQILSALVFVAGCVLLHLRLRRPSSLSLLLSIGAQLAWLIWGMSFFLRIDPVSLGLFIHNEAPAVLYWVYTAHLITAAMTLWFAVSFLLAIKAIGTVSKCEA